MALRSFLFQEMSKYSIPFNPELFAPQQSLNSCAVSIQHSIFEDALGANYDEDLTSLYAMRNGIFNLQDGTYDFCMGEIARKIGFQVTEIQRPTLENLQAYKESGHAIMLSYDSGEMHNLEDLDCSANDMDPDHAGRFVDYDRAANQVLIGDPAPELGGDIVRIDAERFQKSDVKAWVIEKPHDGLEASRIKSALYENIIKQDKSELSEFKIERDFHDQYPESYERMLSEAQYAGIDAGADANEIPEKFKRDVDGISLDIGNLVATGAFMSIVDYYKDNPAKAKQVTKVAMGLGIFDALTNFGPDEVNFDFEMNPLLVASFAFYITKFNKFPKNSFCLRIPDQPYH